MVRRTSQGADETAQPDAARPGKIRGRAGGLSALACRTIKEPGRHADGNGLYLVVGATGSRSWVYMFKRSGKRRELGLGSFPAVSLEQARRTAADYRRLVETGADPGAVRDQQRTADAKPATFGDVALALLTDISGGFRNEKHRAQWKSTLRTHCKPIWNEPVADIGVEAVLSCLRPIWLKTPETARRLQGRMARVLDAAKARGLRSGENPAAWAGNLKLLLPRPARLTRGHHAAMPLDDLPIFMTRLAERSDLSSLALRFTILTGGRTGECLGARWSEIDLAGRAWRIPGSRMKAGKPHAVPLSDAALAILRQRADRRTSDDDDFIFPGQRRGQPLSNMALLMTLRRLKVAGATAHGFRASFKTWGSERTAFPRELVELSLAHAIGNAVEAAYLRGDLLERRRPLMQAWADFVCGTGVNNVIPLLPASRGW
jgi:integrase